MPEDPEAAMHHRFRIGAISQTQSRFEVELSGNLQRSALAVQTNNPDAADEIGNRWNLSGYRRWTGRVEIAQFIASCRVGALITVPQTKGNGQVTQDLCAILGITRVILVPEVHLRSVTTGHCGLAEQQFRDRISGRSPGCVRSGSAGKRP